MKLQWNDYKDINSVPLDELLLVEVDKENNRKQFKSAEFGMGGDGNVFGIVGDHFHFDEDILRWASIQHLVEE